MNATPDIRTPTAVMSASLAEVDPDNAEFTAVADVIAAALVRGSSADVPALRARVARLAREFPLYEGLEDRELHGRR